MAFEHFLLGSHNFMVTALGLVCEVALICAQVQGPFAFMYCNHLAPIASVNPTRSGCSLKSVRLRPIYLMGEKKIGLTKGIHP